jgi:glutamyl-tRNA synthetase
MLLMSDAQTNASSAPGAVPYRGRLAPSPTGAQHIGNARTYLISWLAARAVGGSVLLRIEDIDSPRVKSGAAEQVLDDLRWLGLDWDEQPVVQSSRLASYESALRLLQERDLVYPCTCSRTDIENAASAPHAEHEGPPYPGTCAGRRAADANSLPAQSFSWRIRAGCPPVEYRDGFLGSTHVNPGAAGGDFVVWKSAGTPAYQLAVVADDAAMGVTEVIRGDDLVPSTPRQLLLYRYLDLTPPRFAHVPLVVGTDGRRLAKRHGDTRLISLRQAGVPPEAVNGLLAWSCGWLKRIEPVTARDLIPHFQLASIPPRPFVLDAALLHQIGYRSAS